MSKPVIFTISAAWDSEASVWSGHCDDIPAAADAPTLDELLAKISAMALDLLPDNHPDVAPDQLFLQITALREAEPVTGRMAPQFDRALRDLLRAAVSEDAPTYKNGQISRPGRPKIFSASTRRALSSPWPPGPLPPSSSRSDAAVRSPWATIRSPWL